MRQKLDDQGFTLIGSSSADFQRLLDTETPRWAKFIQETGIQPFEKSLGSSMKGGTTGLMEVYRYAEPVTQPGLVFMDTPGFDPVSATGQIAGGANIICFTTGRGSMFGAKPVPSIKLATNTPMYERLTEDMDLNCGKILDGTASMEEVGQRIFEKILQIASGERSTSEELGLGDHEFVPWNIGVVS